MAKFIIEGLEKWDKEIGRQIKLVENKTKRVIQKRSQLTERDAKKLAAVDTGTMRNSITVTHPIEDRGFSAEISAQAINPRNGFDYAVANEKGTRKMAAQPFLVPAFDNQVEKLEADLTKIARKIGD